MIRCRVTMPWLRLLDKCSLRLEINGTETTGWAWSLSWLLITTDGAKWVRLTTQRRRRLNEYAPAITYKANESHRSGPIKAGSPRHFRSPMLLLRQGRYLPPVLGFMVNAGIPCLETMVVYGYRRREIDVRPFFKTEATPPPNPIKRYSTSGLGASRRNEIRGSPFT